METANNAAFYLLVGIPVILILAGVGYVVFGTIHDMASNPAGCLLWIGGLGAGAMGIWLFFQGFIWLGIVLVLLFFALIGLGNLMDM